MDGGMQTWAGVIGAVELVDDHDLERIGLGIAAAGSETVACQWCRIR